jgi:hypothetical protein
MTASLLRSNSVAPHLFYHTNFSKLAMLVAMRAQQAHHGSKMKEAANEAA